jgi:uncharacterized protein DUF4232
MGSTVRSSIGLAAALAGAALLGACGSGHVPSSASGSTTTTPATVAPGTTTGSAGTTPVTTAGSTPAVATTTAPTRTSTVATGPIGCVASQLNVNVSYGNYAAGSIGYTNSFQNISSTTCTLFGYPGMQMLNSSGQPIQTDVIRGTSVTVPAVPVRLVTLAPGGKAWFDMGFSDGSGYGNDYDSCPTSTLVEFTAPNDFQSITISLQIQPFGGATIAQLNCGEIHVSPVFAVA